MPIKLGVEVIVPQQGLYSVRKINRRGLSRWDQSLFETGVAKQPQKHSLK
jgi:hypothetical protein